MNLKMSLFYTVFFISTTVSFHALGEDVELDIEPKHRRIESIKQEDTYTEDSIMEINRLMTRRNYTPLIDPNAWQE